MYAESERTDGTTHLGRTRYFYASCILLTNHSFRYFTRLGRAEPRLFTIWIWKTQWN